MNIGINIDVCKKINCTRYWKVPYQCSLKKCLRKDRVVGYRMNGCPLPTGCIHKSLQILVGDEIDMYRDCPKECWEHK